MRRPPTRGPSRARRRTAWPRPSPQPPSYASPLAPPYAPPYREHISLEHIYVRPLYVKRGMLSGPGCVQGLDSVLKGVRGAIDPEPPEESRDKRRLDPAGAALR